MRKETSEPPAIPHPHYEALLRVRERDPAAFRALPPKTRLAVLSSEAAEREAARLQEVRGEGRAASRAGREWEV